MHLPAPSLSLFLLTACGATRIDDPTSAPPTTVRPTAGPMDGSPGRRTKSPQGRWEALVAEGGALSVRPAGHVGAEVPVDVGVDPRVAIAADDGVLVYARAGQLAETDLWRMDLPSGAPVQLTAWRGSEDRPVLSPDGHRLAFVSGRTGIASWWVIDLDHGLPVPPESARQLSNLGVESAPRRPGVPPVGFLPVPDGTVYAWTADGLTWVAAGHAYALAVPP